VVNIEECALSAFEQNTFASIGKILQHLRNIRGNWRNDLGCSQRFVQSLGKVHRFGAKIIL